VVNHDSQLTTGIARWRETSPRISPGETAWEFLWSLIRVSLRTTIKTFISSDNFVSDITSPLGNSDHCVLYFHCHLNIYQSKSTDKFKWDKGDYKLTEFLDITWDAVLDAVNNSVDEMWEIFKLIVTEGMNNFFPRRAQASIK